MNTSHSAKIYQFPSKGRDLVDAKREAERRGRVGPARPIANVGGGAWYHDAAIIDAERSRLS